MAWLDGQNHWSSHSGFWLWAAMVLAIVVPIASAFWLIWRPDRGWRRVPAASWLLAIATFAAGALLGFLVYAAFVFGPEPVAPSVPYWAGIVAAVGLGLRLLWSRTLPAQ